MDCVLPILWHTARIAIVLSNKVLAKRLSEDEDDRCSLTASRPAPSGGSGVIIVEETGQEIHTIRSDEGGGENLLSAVPN